MTGKYFNEEFNAASKQQQPTMSICVCGSRSGKRYIRLLVHKLGSSLGEI